VGLLAACYATFVGAVIWHINCPGAAEISSQRDVCDSVGSWGGAVAMGIALAAATVVSVFLLRRSPRAASRWAATLLVVASLVTPLLGTVLAYAALTAPGDYCTREQREAEAQAVQEWRDGGERGDRPDWCSAYEGS
jgi:phosphate/sulfate permease